ncbi:Protein fmp32, mitochondrial [Cryptotrichosporon argae]
MLSLCQPSTSRSGGLVSTALARSMHASAAHRNSHFDTHLFVERLQRHGMTRQQAEGVMVVLAEVVDESITGMESGLVSRAEMEKQRYAQKVDFAQLKSELQMHEKNDLSLMKTENDRLMADVEKLKQRLREEVTRTQAGVRLDLNLEKGRIRDESSQQELKIKEVDTRIEAEIAGLRTQIEQAKFSILQYLVGVATGSGALLLAYMRMMR